MGRSVPLFLTRVAALVAAGLLLFAVFGHTHTPRIPIGTTIRVMNGRLGGGHDMRSWIAGAKALKHRP